MARNGQQASLPFAPAAAAKAPAAAAKAPAAAATAAQKYGTLANRRPKEQEIPRDENGIMHLALNWESRAIVSATVVSKMNHPQKNMITKEIRPIMLELEKKNHLTTVKGQFRGYLQNSHESVRCWEEHGNHIETLMDTVLGGMKESEFKKTINDSTLGKLNKYLAILRTYIEEEMDPKHRSAARSIRARPLVSCLLL